MEPTTETTTSNEPKTYKDKIRVCFAHLCEKNGDGASPAEVTEEMRKRGWLTALDTVIDIKDIMGELRNEGAL